MSSNIGAGRGTLDSLGWRTELDIGTTPSGKDAWKVIHLTGGSSASSRDARYGKPRWCRKAIRLMDLGGF